MSTYLFRNPNANYKLTSFNRRLAKLKNTPVLVLLAIGTSYLGCYLF